MLLEACAHEPLVALLAVLPARAVAARRGAMEVARQERPRRSTATCRRRPNVPEQDILSRPAARRCARTARRRRCTGAASAASAAAAPADGARAEGADPELEAKRKQAEAEQAAKKKAEEAKVAAAAGRELHPREGQMRSLDSGMRLARTNEKGEREILDDKQRADEAKRAARRRSRPTASSASAPRGALLAALRARRASFGSICSGR